MRTSRVGQLGLTVLEVPLGDGVVVGGDVAEHGEVGALPVDANTLRLPTGVTVAFPLDAPARDNRVQGRLNNGLDIAGCPAKMHVLG